MPSRRAELDASRFFDLSHDVLVVVDRDGEVVSISPSAERVLGWTVEQLMGHSALHRVHPDDRSALERRAEAILMGLAESEVDARIASPGGGWIPMRWSLSAGGGGRIYAVGRDHAERAWHQEALLRNEMAELRLRTARELHDGILQTLTGASLQIAVARRLMRKDAEAADQVLSTLGEAVAAEQQEMRLYVDEMKGRAAIWTDGTRRIGDRVAALLDRLGSIWGVTTTIETDFDGELGGEVGRQILRIVQESTGNAARHGGARNIGVAIRKGEGKVTIVIKDDGGGFSFLGEYDHEALREQRLGPLSLKHRVEDAGGRIGILSTAGGAVVTVDLPIARERSST